MLSSAQAFFISGLDPLKNRIPLPGTSAAIDSVSLPLAAFQLFRRLRQCSVCHGSAAVGTEKHIVSDGCPIPEWIFRRIIPAGVDAIYLPADFPACRFRCFIRIPQKKPGHTAEEGLIRPFFSHGCKTVLFFRRMDSSSHKTSGLFHVPCWNPCVRKGFRCHFHKVGTGFLHCGRKLNPAASSAAGSFPQPKRSLFLFLRIPWQDENIPDGDDKMQNMHYGCSRAKESFSAGYSVR